jgi:hypothetical protein
MHFDNKQVADWHEIYAQLAVWNLRLDGDLVDGRLVAVQLTTRQPSIPHKRVTFPGQEGTSQTMPWNA